MAFVPKLSRFLTRNIRSYIRASVRFYDAEPGGEEIKGTRVTMLSKEDDDNLYVEAYSEVGFRLSNGFRIIGPCVLFPRSILHWAIAGIHEVNEKSLSLFTVLEPKLDILILGIGEHGAKYDKNIIKYLRTHKVNVEVLPTDQACSTFNFLNAEGRVVAAGLIPPKFMQFESEDLLVQAQLQEDKNMYEFEHGYSGSVFDDKPGELARHLEILEEHGYPSVGRTARERKQRRLASQEGEEEEKTDSRSEERRQLEAKRGKDKSSKDGEGSDEKGR